jgi:hypothetical protein
MKNQNKKVTAVLFVVALALTPMVQATLPAQGGPGSLSSRNAPTARKHPAALARPGVSAEPIKFGTPTPKAEDASDNGDASGGSLADRNLPVIQVFSTDNVIRGKTGTFVLRMKSAQASGAAIGGMYVNFSLSGTAQNGVDYKLLTSPAYISRSGYGVIQIETLANPRGSAFNQAYSVIVTLNAGAGYKVGKTSSAIMWIKSGTLIPPNS